MALSRKQKRVIRRERDKRSVGKLGRHIGTDPDEVRHYTDSLETRFEPKKERLFRLAALAIPVLFFLLLEGGLRLFNYGGDLALFVSAPGEYSDYFRCNPDVGKRYFFMQSSVPDPPNDLFLKTKPANAYRLFVMGGSTTAGYPYGNNIMFSRILQKRLADAFPDREIEVVNTAMTAVNTFTVLDFMDEVLNMQPDAILIYSGHNEFYGALGAASTESLGKIRSFVKFYLKLQRFKTFILIRNLIGALKKWVGRTFYDTSLDDPTTTLMERMVGEQTIALGSPIYELGKNQFENNLRDILENARRHHIDVVISELVSNVRDLKPFVSVTTDSLPAASQVYLQAQKLDQQGNLSGARLAYVRAKDLDGLRFRATEEFNELIHSVAEEFDVPVVPMRTDFEKASPEGIIGNNLILEHLHPNIDGYFFMADAFFETMREAGIIDPNWEHRRIAPASYYRQNWGFTPLDSAYADVRIRILKGNWPFKPKSVRNRALIDYQPSTRAESLAVKIWLEKGFNLERGHVMLALEYEKAGEYERAYREYRSLVFMTPQNASAYLGAASMLVKLQDFKRALPYLLTSLKYENSIYANKWIGQIYLNDGKPREALPMLEKAAELSPKDPQLVYNLSGAYALTKQYDLARQTLRRLDELDPNFPGAADLKRQLQKVN